MEQTTLNALERIENPILVILLVALMLACIVLWRTVTTLQKDLMRIIEQHVQAVTNLNATLANISERLERIENLSQKV